MSPVHLTWEVHNLQLLGPAHIREAWITENTGETELCNILHTTELLVLPTQCFHETGRQKFKTLYARLMDPPAYKCNHHVRRLHKPNP